MRRIPIFVLFILFIPCQNAFAHNLNISDYDTTISGAKETRINLGYSKSADLDSDSLATQSDNNSSVSIAHNGFYDSLDRSWSLGFSADYLDRASIYQDPLINDSKYIEHSYSTYYNYNIYFMPEENVFQGISVDYDFGNNEDIDGPVRQYYAPTLSYKIGMGHIIDITPLAEAGVLEDRLIEAGSLKENFSKKEMLKMAEIIRRYRMGEYDYVSQDTAKGKFLEDLIKVIKSSNKLTRELDGFSFWRISESRNVNYLRTKGWIFDVGIKKSSIVEVLSASDDTLSTPYDYIFSEFKIYFPIDWRSQINLSAEYDHVTNYPEDELQNYSTALVSYSYDFTNNFWLSLEGRLGRNNYRSRHESDLISTKNINATLNYKIEDRFLISLNFSRVSYDIGTAQNVFQVSQTLYL